MLSSGNLILSETSTAYPSLHKVLVSPEKKQEIPKKIQNDNRLELVWQNVMLFGLLHAAALYGSYLWLFVSTWKTFIWSFALVNLGNYGVTIGAHRLWAHRTYKAKLPLRICLMICQTLAFQNHIYEWVRDHRVHHKYTDTDADPHNSHRGFFFSHIGWLMARKHKDVIVKGKNIDMSDVEADPVVRFQRRHYIALGLIVWLAIPALVPRYFWGESWRVCWYTCVLFRYALGLNCTWLVNSVAHMWGTRPYDKAISPVESAFVSWAASGEGWHNYHHVFPWDYKAAELGNYELNISTMIIDFCALLGLAYDLKTVSEDMVKSRVQRTGDGSKTFPNFSEIPDCHHENVWGWGDADMKPQDRQYVKILNKHSY